jgi:hypothetical protein
MSDKPKPWPYEAAGERDRAAEEAVAGISSLEPLVESEKDAEKLRRIARTLTALYRIARLMEAAGARTRP